MYRTDRCHIMEFYISKDIAHASSAVLAQSKKRKLLWKSRMWLNLIKSLSTGLGSQTHSPNQRWPRLWYYRQTVQNLIISSKQLDTKNDWKCHSDLNFKARTFFYYTRKGHTTQFSFSHMCTLLINYSRESAYSNTDGKLRHPPRTWCLVH